MDNIYQWYGMIFIDTWNESPERKGKGREMRNRAKQTNKQTPAQTETVSVISAPSLGRLRAINSLLPHFNLMDNLLTHTFFLP